MTIDDRPVFAEAMYGLAIATGEILSDDTLRIYRQGLEDWPIQRIVSALEECARVCKDWPSLASIRGMVSPDHAPGSQPSGRIGSVACGRCGGTGWEVQERIGQDGGPVRYARKCACRLRST